VDIGVIDTLVAVYYGIEVVDLPEHGRRVGTAKYVAVELACRLTGMNQRAVGSHYGGISSAAVSTIRRKIREGKYDVAPVVEELLAQIRNIQDVKVNI
jgi:anti-sigma28 factor (negative regulator of flagellin synthesis)